MRIVLTNTFHRSGGAALAAARLYTGLRAAGADVTFYARKPDFTGPGIAVLDERLAPDERKACLEREQAAERRLQSLGNGRDLRWVFTPDQSPAGDAFIRHMPPADVVNLHWVAGFLDYPSFFAAGIPTVWTMHDMLPLTGGCHYPGACERFTDGCGACPLLGSAEQDDESRASFLRKRTAITNRRSGLRIVTPSRWLAAEVRRSAMFEGVAVTVIPNGIDTTRFAPIDKAEARRRLGLPADRPTLLFVADNVLDERKGFADLALALRRLDGAAASPAPLLISVGARAPTLPAGAFTHRHLGHIGASSELACAYGAADAVVVPTRQDNLPNVILESFACGRPVIGTDVGGVPDLVRPGDTGLLVPPRDPDALAGALGTVLSIARTDRQGLDAMGQRARALVLRECSLAVQAARYRDLYAAVAQERRLSGA